MIFYYYTHIEALVRDLASGYIYPNVFYPEGKRYLALSNRFDNAVFLTGKRLRKSVVEKYCRSGSLVPAIVELELPNGTQIFLPEQGNLRAVQVQELGQGDRDIFISCPIPVVNFCKIYCQHLTGGAYSNVAYPDKMMLKERFPYGRETVKLPEEISDKGDCVYRHRQAMQELDRKTALILFLERYDKVIAPNIGELNEILHFTERDLLLEWIRTVRYQEYGEREFSLLWGTSTLCAAVVRQVLFEDVADAAHRFTAVQRGYFSILYAALCACIQTGYVADRQVQKQHWKEHFCEIYHACASHEPNEHERVFANFPKILEQRELADYLEKFRTEYLTESEGIAAAVMMFYFWFQADYAHLQQNCIFYRATDNERKVIFMLYAALHGVSYLPSEYKAGYRNVFSAEYFLSGTEDGTCRTAEAEDFFARFVPEKERESAKRNSIGCVSLEEWSDPEHEKRVSRELQELGERTMDAFRRVWSVAEKELVQKSSDIRRWLMSIRNAIDGREPPREVCRETPSQTSEKHTHMSARGKSDAGKKTEKKKQVQQMSLLDNIGEEDNDIKG